GGGRRPEDYQSPYLGGILQYVFGIALRKARKGRQARQPSRHLPSGCVNDVARSGKGLHDGAAIGLLQGDAKTPGSVVGVTCHVIIYPPAAGPFSVPGKFCTGFSSPSKGSKPH